MRGPLWALLAAGLVVGGGCTQKIALPGVQLADAGVDRTERPDVAPVDRAEPPPDQAVAPPVDASSPADGPLACQPIDPSNLHQRHPQVVLAVDRSMSMFQKYGTSTSTRLHLLEFVLQGLVDTYKYSVMFGYIDFPSHDCNDDSCCAGNIVDPSFHLFDDPSFNHRWECDSPDSGCPDPGQDSPVSRALHGIRYYYENASQGPSTRQILLFTDGEPICSSASSDECTNSMREVALLLSDVDVFTRVFALTEELGKSPCLTKLAMMGADPSLAKPPTGPDVTSTTESLLSAVDAVLDKLSVEACTFQLPSPLGPGQTLQITANGTVVAQDTKRKEGWDFDVPDGPTQFTFYGSTCERIRKQSQMRPRVFAAVCDASPRD